MRSLLFLSVVISTLLISCSKEEFAPGLEGNLVGYAFTFDEFAVLLGDHSGITVTTTGPKKYTAITDKKGRYELKRLPTGTYTLQFEKPGFGTMRYYGIKHLGGSATIFGLTSGSSGSSAIFMYKIPRTKILDLYIAGDSLYARFDLKGELPSKMKLYIYFSEISGFSIDKAQQSTPKTLVPVNGIYRCKLNQSSFNPPLSRGKEIFFRASIYNTANSVSIPVMSTAYQMYISGINTYIDYVANRTVYPNNGDPSDQYSFITPQ